MRKRFSPTWFLVLMGLSYSHYVTAGFEEEGEKKLEILRNRILILTEAVPNIRRNTIDALENLLSDLSDAESTIVCSLLPKLNPPEVLIAQDSPENTLAFRQAFLDEARPSSTHPALTPLHTLIREMEKLPPFLHTTVSTLMQLYKTFSKQLCAALPERRAQLLEPRVEMSGAGLGHYLITQETARDLLSLDDMGGLQLRNTQGTSPVTFRMSQDRTWGVHFKADGRKTNPTLPALKPALEASVFWFYQLLTGQGIVPSCVLVLNNVITKRPSPDTKLPKDLRIHLSQSRGRSIRAYFQKHPNSELESALEKTFVRCAEDYVLQASETVLCEDFEAWVKTHGNNESPFQELCQRSLSSHFLSSLLVNLGDAKADNYRLNTNRELIGIDNDHVFVDELRKSGRMHDDTEEHYMGIRCLFYAWKHLLDADLSSDIRKRLTQSLQPSPVIFLSQWLQKLDALDQDYRRLQSQGYLSDFWFKHQMYQRDCGESVQEEYREPLFPTLLPQNLMRHLVTKIEKLKRLLSDSTIQTHDQALRFMNPFMEVYYRHVRKKSGDDLWQTLGYIYQPQSIEEELREGGDSVRRLFSVRDPIPLTYAAYPQTVQDLAFALAAHWEFPETLHEEHVSVIEALLPFLTAVRLHDLPENWHREDVLGALIGQGLSLEGILWFVRGGALLHGRDALGRTPLHHAVLYGQQNLSHAHQQITTLLRQGAPVEMLDKQRITPLSLALTFGDKESIIQFIRAGAFHTSHHLVTPFFQQHVQDKPLSPLTTAFGQLLGRNNDLAWRLTLDTLLPTQGKGTAIRTASYEARVIPSDLENQLLDAKGVLKRQNVYGRRDVSSVKRETGGFSLGLYFKKYPELPGLEEAVGRLTRKLIGFGAPFVDLVDLKGEPVLISQAIEGESLQDALKQTPDKNPGKLNQLDPKSLSEMILVAMLVNPEDGKPDNYILQRLPDNPEHFRLVGIDNDHAFVPAVAREQKQGWGRKHEVVQVKSVLYCLDQMKHPVHPDVRAHFIMLDPSALLKSWLIELKDVNDRFNLLFTPEQAEAFFPPESLLSFLSNDTPQSFLGIPFQETMIPHLYQKMLRMQQILEENKNLTHLDLLIQLEPQLGKRYQLALDKPLSVLKRFEEVDGSFYSQAIAGHHLTRINSRHILQSIEILSKKSVMQDIRAGKAYSPHIGLQQLGKLIHQQTKEVIWDEVASTAGGSYVLEELKLPEKQEKFLETRVFQIMTVQRQQGIIRWLQSQPDTMSQWRTFSFKYSPVLTEADLSKIEMGNITSLDLQGCNRLGDTVLTLLARLCPSLEKLNLSKNNNFIRISAAAGGFFGAPQTLSFNTLKILNLSHCSRLQAIACEAPQLTLLELQGCPSLERLALTVPRLQKADLRDNKVLTDELLERWVSTTSCLTVLPLEGCDQVTEKEWRAQFPWYPASYLKGMEKKHKDSIQRLLSNDSVLTNLDLHNNNLGERGGKAIAAALEKNAILRYLNLNYINLGEESGKAIAVALEKNATLTSLQLGFNNLGERGGKAIAAALEKNATLTDLNLGDNNLGEGSGKAIAVALEKNATLTDLNLGDNNLGEGSGKAIAAALEKNATLTDLNLENNNLGEGSGKAIAAALEKNETLTDLNLENNNLGPETEKIIELLLGRNKRLLEQRSRS